MSAAERPAAAASEPRGLDTPAAGILLVLAAATLWSTSGLFIKILTLDGFALTGWRSAIGFIALTPLIKYSKVRLDWNLVRLMIAFSLTQLCFVFATRWTTAANAIALQSTAPAWVFLLGCLAARRVPVPLLWPIGVILLGIAIMLAEPVRGTSMDGNLLALFGGFTFGVAQISFKRVDQPAVGVVALGNLATALLCLAVRPQAFQVEGIALWEWVSLAYLGAFQIGLACVLFIAGLRRITVGQGSILSLIEPLLNPVWVFLLVGEAPSPYGFAGFALILAGILADLWVRLRFPPGALSPQGE